ncbi:MAG: hypothetical protein AAGA56_24855, partial [Myxococcota bacterium]
MASDAKRRRTVGRLLSQLVRVDPEELPRFTAEGKTVARARELLLFIGDTLLQEDPSAWTQL